MIASKGLILVLVLLSSTSPSGVADRVYSTLRLSDYPKTLRAATSEKSTSAVVDRWYSHFSRGGKAPTASLSSSERADHQRFPTARNGLLLAALYFYIKFMSPRPVHFLSVMCGRISEFKKSLESRSDDIFSCRYQQRRRHRHRRRSCGSGATTKYRNGTDERNKCNIREKKYADPIDDDGKSMSPSVLEILGLADLGDDDDDDEEYKNGDTNVDDQSFISNNSTISTVSSFFSLLRSRRGAATSSEKKYVIRTNAQNLRLASDYVSSSLPAVLHLNDGECVQDIKLRTIATSVVDIVRLWERRKKLIQKNGSMTFHICQRLQMIADCKTDNSHRKKSHKLHWYSMRCDIWLMI